MIIDKIENIERYDYVPYANRVAEFLKNNDIKTYAADAIDATGYTGDTLTVYYAKTLK